jgi:hypothetical protein
VQTPKDYNLTGDMRRQHTACGNDSCRAILLTAALLFASSAPYSTILAGLPGAASQATDMHERSYYIHSAPGRPPYQHIPGPTMQQHSVKHFACQVSSLRRSHRLGVDRYAHSLTHSLCITQ